MFCGLHPEVVQGIILGGIPMNLDYGMIMSALSGIRLAVYDPNNNISQTII